jgi:hypothetical protein
LDKTTEQKEALAEWFEDLSTHEVTKSLSPRSQPPRRRWQSENTSRRACAMEAKMTARQRGDISDSALDDEARQGFRRAERIGWLEQFQAGTSLGEQREI